MNSADNVSQRIKAFNNNLLPHTVAIKYQKLAEGPFRFYRGTNHLFYEDLARSDDFPASPDVWLCGDLHLENFGSYKGDNRLVYFDISDFDEAILGPALWEIVRMVTSIYLGLDALQINEAEIGDHAQIFLNAYSGVLASGKARHIELQTARGVIKELLVKVSNRNVEKWLKKRVEINGTSGPVFRNIENKQWIIEDEAFKSKLIGHISGIASASFERLMNFTVLDVCFRIAGTGSLGLQRYLFLMETADKTHWLLDMKQARTSSLSHYLSTGQPQWSSEAERVVGVEFIMQDVPEALLTTSVFNGEEFKIQEMQPTEDKVEFHQVQGNFESIASLLKDMASLTASAQLRSSGRHGSAIGDELVAFGKTNEWKDHILRYAREYARQVKEDYRQYLDDYNKGFFQGR